MSGAWFISIAFWSGIVPLKGGGTYTDKVTEMVLPSSASNEQDCWLDATSISDTINRATLVPNHSSLVVKCYAVSKP